MEHVGPVLGRLVDAVLGGGPGTVAILILIIGFLVWDRLRLIKEIARYQTRLDKIVDDYHKGNLTLAEAMNSLRMVLFEIKAKI